MPLRPVTGTLNMPLKTQADVQALFDQGLSLSKRELGVSRYMNFQRDLADHLHYLGAIQPTYFRSLQEAIVAVPDEQLANFSSVGNAWLYLMHDAPDSCVEQVARRLNDSRKPAGMAEFVLEELLAAVCTPAALEEMARYATRMGKRQEFENRGFWLPEGAARAQQRFTLERRAVRVARSDESVEGLEQRRHPVGLPVSQINADPAQNAVVWHYCGIATRDVAGLPILDCERLHLVSPPLFGDWTLFARVDQGDRYSDVTLSTAHEQGEGEIPDMRALALRKEEKGKGYLTLLPYDDELIYCNGHTELTRGVVGDVGGQPIGLYPNPSCPACGKLMFHVMSVSTAVRPFGEGFRSLFVCEECEIVASHATGWN